MEKVDVMIAALTHEQFIKEHWMQKPRLFPLGELFLDAANLLPPREILILHANEWTRGIDYIYRGLSRVVFRHFPIDQWPDMEEVVMALAESFVMAVYQLDETNAYYNTLARALANHYLVTLPEYPGFQVGAFIALNKKVGLERHKDLSHVFVFQHSGVSRWRVYDADNKHLVFDGYLKPGNVLYVPAGFYHVVKRMTAETCHVSVGFRYTSPDHAAQALCWSPVLQASLTAEQRYLLEKEFLTSRSLKPILKRRFNIIKTHTRVT